MCAKPSCPAQIGSPGLCRCACPISSWLSRIAGTGISLQKNHCAEQHALNSHVRIFPRDEFLTSSRARAFQGPRQGAWEDGQGAQAKASQGTTWSKRPEQGPDRATPGKTGADDSPAPLRRLPPARLRHHQPRAACRRNEPRRSPHHLLRLDAHRAPRGAEPDHHRHGASDHRPPLRGFREPVVGGHRLSPDLDRGGAALRQALRHPWPARDAAHRGRPVRRRLRALRGGAQHDAADHRPRPAGPRRRRHPAAVPVRHRRRGRPARARPLPGLYGRGVGDVGRGRAGARRRARGVSGTGR